VACVLVAEVLADGIFAGKELFRKAFIHHSNVRRGGPALFSDRASAPEPRSNVSK